MRKWQAYSVFALLCGGIGAACGASGTSAPSDTSAVAAMSVPSANTANLDAVMSSAVTQNYLTAASKNRRCAADANAVIQIVQTLASALGDSNATVGAGANNGNFSITGDANSAAVIAVFEQDLPELQTALATLQSCVQNICGDHDMPNMPTFPCGKPGSSTFPNHSGNSNTTDGNTMCGGDSHHGTTTGSTTRGTTTGSTTHGTTTAGTSTGGTTAGTTTSGTTTAGTTTAGTTTAGTTTAGTTTGTVGVTTGGTTGATTGTAGTTTAGTTTGSSTAGTTAGTTTGSSTAGTTTNGVVTEPNTVLPGTNATASSCISVVLGGRAFVGCGVAGLQ